MHTRATPPPTPTPASDRVERRHVELDRGERRLEALASVRPANSQEVAALEARLGALYQQYLHRWAGASLHVPMELHCCGGGGTHATRLELPPSRRRSHWKRQLLRYCPVGSETLSGWRPS